jgi:AcrR family transcriptional regulator
VIIREGYAAVSIEAIAGLAGVTRPVVYDHFPNLGRLLQSLCEREERRSMAELEQVVPAAPGDRDPVAVLAEGVRRFLDAVANRPETWRLILLPLDRTPKIVREHVERNRAEMLRRIERIVQWAIERRGLPAEIDVELTARAIRDLAEAAGRMVLTDPERYPPERYEQFVQTVMGMVWQ